MSDSDGELCCSSVLYRGKDQLFSVQGRQTQKMCSAHNPCCYALPHSSGRQEKAINVLLASSGEWVSVLGKSLSQGDLTIILALDLRKTTPGNAQSSPASHTKVWLSSNILGRPLNALSRTLDLFSRSTTIEQPSLDGNEYVDMVVNGKEKKTAGTLSSQEDAVTSGELSFAYHGQYNITSAPWLGLITFTAVQYAHVRIAATAADEDCIEAHCPATFRGTGFCAKAEGTRMMVQYFSLLLVLSAELTRYFTPAKSRVSRIGKNASTGKTDH
ncbi:uncharacterized protein EV420DRAFT_1486010 [Desarmillaria tabescens]|uniref:Uncharacterized protein n=1 Tax=Armillaria tabescens TaxID=1929756 RepID=A0AA39JCE3_ARMTA|nr:uncharacterized protein EV420DRAFT_1486010 [Desarmillaria tabescens]KAK0440182.1 hypothetical protein EV420DRAFT_1486010 [Desarmillaria tabescens]